MIRKPSSLDLVIALTLTDKLYPSLSKESSRSLSTLPLGCPVSDAYARPSISRKLVRSLSL